MAAETAASAHAEVAKAPSPGAGNTFQASIALRFGVAALTQEIRVRVLRTAAASSGSSIWLSWPDIYSALGGEDAQAWHVCKNKRWATCDKFINDADIEAGALLDSARASHSKHKCEYAFQVVSMRAWLLLLLRWSSDYPHTGRLSHIASAAGAFLAALLCALPDNDMVLTVATQGIQTPTPYTIDGEGAQRILVASGSADLAKLWASNDSEEFGLCLLGLCDKGAADLLELSRASPALKRKLSRGLGLLPQLVWQVGAHLEDALLQVPVVARSALPSDDSGPWWDKSALVCENGPITRDQRAALCFAVTKRNAEILNANACVAVAVDAGRFGRRHWSLGAYCVPSAAEFASWLCPQAQCLDKGGRGFFV